MSAADGTTAAPHRSLRALDRLRRAATLALVLPALLFALTAAYLYRQEFAAARTQLEGDVRVVHEHALKLLETNEMLLQRMLDLVGQQTDEQLLARGAELHERLKAMSANLPQVQGLFVVAPDARMLATDRVHPPPRHIDFSDREFYAFHRDARGPVFVTEQLTSRTTGEAFFDVSRRRESADGRFAGTVGVSLRPEYLTNFYRELAVASPHLRMAVIRSDGRFVARFPEAVSAGMTVPADSPVMKAIAAGQTRGWIEQPAAFGNGHRLFAFRRLGDWPLYVATGFDRQAVVSRWWQRIGWIALFLVPAALGFAAMAWLAVKRTREEIDALQRLEAETAFRQRAEAALLQSQKLEALGRLTGGVAHDFNNLLMIVSNNLFLIQHRHPDLAEGKPLAAIGRAVASGSKLTRQLLAFARKQALLRQSVSLQQRLPELLELIRPLVGAAIEVECEVAADTAAIEVDAAEFELALINLAVNARDAMQGRGRFLIQARNASDADRPPGLAGAADAPYVLVECRDSGPGIDPGVAERAFEPFFTTKPVGQGTGLGLAQVQALCASARGIATIEGGSGGGARVRMLFAAAAPAPAAAPREPALRSQALHCRVLLVEDNLSVAEATQEVLQTLGCRVQRAPGSAEALAALEADPAGFDVVLSDIEMPGGMDGIALATVLAGRVPPLPVVLMTGYAARLEQAVQQRFDVLPKPCSPALLAEALGKAVRRRTAPAAEPVNAAPAA